MTDNPVNGLDTEAPRIIPPPQDQLVDRKKQLEKFTDVLDRISRQGPVSSNLFEWYGSPGIGKSMLVAILARQADARHASWALINFRKSAGKKTAYLQDPVTLIEEVVSDLGKQVSLNTLDLEEKIKIYRTTSLPNEEWSLPM